MSSKDQRAFRVHVTNIVGTGAVHLVASLLPALERAVGYQVDDIHLPDRGPLVHYGRIANGPAPVHWHRRLPNALSRVLECLLWAHRFDGKTPLLVLGDLPLRCAGRQVVFVQTQHVTQAEHAGSWVGAIKYRIARAVFRATLDRPAAFIVQSETMKAALVDTYPRLSDRVHVVPQPVPAWLLNTGLRRTGRRRLVDADLVLFYPAAPYPHKNHRLLAKVDSARTWPVEQLLLTIPPSAHPHPQLAWIKCVGLLPPESVVGAYAEADALVFLSIAESYGLPLVEAMWIGLPIVCPDLPYARSLCGDQAFYFEHTNVESLRLALVRLHARLAAGWWPDWSKRLEQIPKDWDAVASAMLLVLFPASTGRPAPAKQPEALPS